MKAHGHCDELRQRARLHLAHDLTPVHFHGDLRDPELTDELLRYGSALYSVKAVLHGKAGDVFEMIGENLP